MTVETLGSYLREQRVAAELSLRQLAEQAGVSNPYLSQIERGLRRPSAEVLQALAKALRISAEQVYVQAGILNPDDDQVRSVELAILGDPVLSERQKQALLEIYEAFRATSILTDELTEGTTASPIDGESAPADVRPGVPGQATTTEGA
jgi:transcriptional regulator with XRE-family HTH domain